MPPSHGNDGAAAPADEKMIFLSRYNLFTDWFQYKGGLTRIRILYLKFSSKF